MYEEDVEYLKSCLAAGLLVWWMGNNGYVRVTAIHDELLSHEEEGPCGILQTPRFQYIALDSVDNADITVTSPAITKFPSESA